MKINQIYGRIWERAAFRSFFNSPLRLFYCLFNGITALPCQSPCGPLVWGSEAPFRSMCLEPFWYILHLKVLTLNVYDCSCSAIMSGTSQCVKMIVFGAQLDAFRHLIYIQCLTLWHSCPHTILTNYICLFFSYV